MDELAKEGAMMDGGEMAQDGRASTVQQKREEVCAALQHAANFHCLVEEWHDCEGLKPQADRKIDICGQKEKLGDTARSGVRPRADTIV